MAKLWQQSTEHRNDNAELSHAVNRFTVGDDYRLDQRLVPYDVAASKAHAAGLHSIGILTDDELQTLKQALDNALNRWNDDAFEISREQEDVHTALEEFLIAEASAVGKKIHTGRSRNDQVLVALRLFEKDQLQALLNTFKQLISAALTQAADYKSIPMPGYTHTQKAMPSSVGMWLGALAEQLLMDAEWLKATYKHVNRCPLGTGAGFGVSFELPRQQVSDSLGFAEPVVVSLTAQNTRGKIDLGLLQALDAVGSTLANFASDVVLYTAREFDFFRFPDAMYTGSSIMPQKKNVDPAELIRARSANISGAVQAVKLMVHKMNSGYHRDYQPVKKHVMHSLDELHALLDMSLLLINHLQPNIDKLRAACTPEIYAADRANARVKKGQSFRDAYHAVKQEGATQSDINPDENIAHKTHLGATGNLGLQRLQQKVAALSFS